MFDSIRFRLRGFPGRLRLALGLVAAWLPTAAAESPLKLEPGVHPLVDRRLIERVEGLTHRLAEPVRREVVLTLDRPWEGKMSGYGTILRDPEGKVRLYYRGGGDIDPPEVTCVALSDDGIRFERPVLRLHKIRGTDVNNVVFTAEKRKAYGESHNFAPFVDTRPGVPASERWKAAALRVDTDDKGERRRMLGVLASPDGYKWTHLTPRPVIREGSFDSLNRVFYDPASSSYLCYFRVGIDGRRSFGRARSLDFRSWTIEPPLTFRPAQDEQWYTNGVLPYPDVPGLMLALPMRFVPERKTVGDPSRTTDGLSDAVLMTSRDGRTWDRTFRHAFLRPGPDARNWGNAHGNNTPLAGLIATAPGEWSVYWFEGPKDEGPRIRRGTVRAHGLAFLRAEAEPGRFVTPPIAPVPSNEPARGLRLNFATSAAGSIRVEVLDVDGKPLPGRGLDEAEEIYGDEPNRRVRWKTGDRLPTDAPYRLRFHLREADLFALTFDRAETR